MKLRAAFASVLTVQIQDNVDECLNMPCQAAKKPGSGNQNEVRLISLICSMPVCRWTSYVCFRTTLYTSHNVYSFDTASIETWAQNFPHKHALSMHIPEGHQHIFFSPSIRSGAFPIAKHLRLQSLGAMLQVADLRKKIEEEQRMLMQWSEERLALAQSLLGLLELHVTQANKDIAAFDGELQVSHGFLCL